MEQENTKNLRTSLAVLIVIVMIVGGVMAFTKKTPDASQAANSSDSSSTNQAVMPMMQSTSGTYKDGSYSATGDYTSPAGRESITISVTMKDGVVTSTSAQSGANNRDSAEFQAQFISSYKKLVVGKKIDSISLNHVSGSSLTSQGFNDALNQIRSHAQA